MIDIIIFSKDRACQLDALLRSILNNFLISNRIIVVYTYSNNKFKKGYDFLISKKYLNQLKVTFIKEQNFMNDVLNCLNKINSKFIIFMVDDNIIKQKFDEIEIFNTLLQHQQILCCSLRLGKNINYCYALNMTTKIPIDDNLIWNWKNQPGDWGYPMSLDGHIFRTSDFLPYIQKLYFTGPNYLEGMMALNPINKPYMTCFEISKIINIPANRVQNIVSNRNESSISSNALNNLFLIKQQIKLQKIYSINNNSCHFPISFEFEYAND